MSDNKIILLNQPGKIIQKQKSVVLYDAYGRPIQKKKNKQRYCVHPRAKEDFKFAAKHRLFDVLNAIVDQGLAVVYEIKEK